MRKANVVLNGEHYEGVIDLDNYTIAADGGYNMLAGREVDVFLGDGDSVTEKSILARELIHLPCEKDMTDGEYAIDLAIERGYEYIDLYGVNGGRLDHIMTNLNLLARATLKGVKIVAHANDFDLYFTAGNEKFTIDNVNGKTISIVPFDVNTHIIDMEGLYYKVSDFDIARSSSRGMSNVAISDRVAIDFGEGSAFVFVLR